MIADLNLWAYEMWQVVSFSREINRITRCAVDTNRAPGQKEKTGDPKSGFSLECYWKKVLSVPPPKKVQLIIFCRWTWAGNHSRWSLISWGGMRSHAMENGQNKVSTLLSEDVVGWINRVMGLVWMRHSRETGIYLFLEIFRISSDGLKLRLR